MRKLVLFMSDYGDRQVKILRAMSSFEIGLTLYVTFSFFTFIIHDMLLFSVVLGLMFYQFTMILSSLDRERKAKKRLQVV